jgi:hypothetical protein
LIDISPGAAQGIRQFVTRFNTDLLAIGGVPLTDACRYLPSGLGWFRRPEWLGSMGWLVAEWTTAGCI